MGSIKEINITDRTYYLFDDMIKIKDFNLDLLKIDKKSYTKILIFITLDISQWYIEENGCIEETMEISTWFLLLQIKIK